MSTGKISVTSCEQLGRKCTCRQSLQQQQRSIQMMVSHHLECLPQCIQPHFKGPLCTCKWRTRHGLGKCVSSPTQTMSWLASKRRLGVSHVGVERLHTFKRKVLDTNAEETAARSVAGDRSTIRVAVVEWDLSAPTRHNLTAHTLNGMKREGRQETLASSRCVASLMLLVIPTKRISNPTHHSLLCALPSMCRNRHRNRRLWNNCSAA